MCGGGTPMPICLLSGLPWCTAFKGFVKQRSLWKDNITANIFLFSGYTDRFPLSPSAPEGGGGEEQANGITAGVPGRADQGKPPPNQHGEREAHQRAQGKQTEYIICCWHW